MRYRLGDHFVYCNLALGFWAKLLYPTAIVQSRLQARTVQRSRRGFRRAQTVATLRSHGDMLDAGKRAVVLVY